MRLRTSAVLAGGRSGSTAWCGAMAGPGTDSTARRTCMAWNSLAEQKNQTLYLSAPFGKAATSGKRILVVS
jgi:hypothetical protein